MRPFTPARVGPRLPLILLLVCLGHLAGCGSLPQFGKSGSAEATGGSTTSAGSPGAEQVYFAGQDNLTVYEQASARSTHVGQLALHQKVLRSQISNGYAQIRTPDDQLKGWVDNARLIWRLPAAESPSQPVPTEPDASMAAPEAAPPAPSVPEAQPAEHAPAPVSQETIDRPAPAPATGTAAEAPVDEAPRDTPDASASKPEPSVFDSF